ncbi:L,D-transpeptidase-like protein [Sphingobacterium allocomposti]|uniref:L,D-transpeptidase-like protein n=1 Tax=Sphingobacterium allocomposti TaxID=415956 RepID=A0A5S5CSS5_9SPHI|nr:L,D-transpeptidase [Sphingobacterium composti Yoo et al. 2007 non Ten et al. 2007]TYP86665.1 L,D-transpeptidase-like protein [Sphingobacterium composti Yoo et al. 2007 non Ten et al. 2007]
MSVYAKLTLFFSCVALVACNPKKETKTDDTAQRRRDSLETIRKAEEEARKRPRTAEDITLNKELAFDKHTLEETYPYKDTSRRFQLDKVKERLAFVENFQRTPATYGILQNHKNKNKEAPLVKKFHRNEYTRISDSLGTERYQSVPLYAVGEVDAPTLYGRDGSLVKLLSSDTVDFVKLEGVSFDGTWEVPKRYIKRIGDTVTFHRVVFVDVTNQNILTVERTGDCEWVIKSMNPATTGRHKPPYAQETPTGIFVVQEKKEKMYYYKDGTTSIEGFAPYASRFTNGAYVHGVPVNNPKGAIIEYSWSLGTIPRSHMCVRNASSHAKFVFDWARKYNSLVVVID